MSAASHQFGKAQPGCSETTTLRDFDGTLHVFGCGSVKTYRCSRTWALPGTRLEPVYVDGYATSYDASGHRTMISSRETSYRSVPTSSGLTSCTEIGDALPPDPSFREGPKPVAAPPVEARTEQGRVTLRLELVLNRTALLTMTADPSVQSDRVGFRLFYLAQDPSQDVCKLAFTLDDRPFATPDATPMRDGQMLSQQLVLEGEKLSSFDQLRRLGLTSCRRGWFLSRDQILRVRELMARLRQELARSVPQRVVLPAPSVAPPAASVAPAQASASTPTPLH
jgi:hypothetical protein